MMFGITEDVSAVAIAIVVLVIGALLTAGGRWFRKAISKSFEDSVKRVVTAPLKELGDALGQSFDELREQNSLDHAEVQLRLTQLETRLAAVEKKVATPPQVVTNINTPAS